MNRSKKKSVLSANTCSVNVVYDDVLLGAGLLSSLSGWRDLDQQPTVPHINDFINWVI